MHRYNLPVPFSVTHGHAYYVTCAVAPLSQFIEQRYSVCCACLQEEDAVDGDGAIEKETFNDAAKKLDQLDSRLSGPPMPMDYAVTPSLPATPHTYTCTSSRACTARVDVYWRNGHTPYLYQPERGTLPSGRQ